MTIRVLIRGGGDLASGVALRLLRAGLGVAIAELEKPLVVRRSVSFAQALFDGCIFVEDVLGQKVLTIEDAFSCLEAGIIPVMADPDLTTLIKLKPDVVIDARMLKKNVIDMYSDVLLVVGLGPGFIAGVNCVAAVETQRGPFLGRVYWSGGPESDTGIPEKVGVYQSERVIHAPDTGTFNSFVNIGDICAAGEVLGSINGKSITAPFGGIIRGLIAHGVEVAKGVKIGDIDPRLDARLVKYVSDKALAVGGGVLEAILTSPGLRNKLAVTNETR